MRMPVHEPEEGTGRGLIQAISRVTHSVTKV
jgi:hypothetical protein